MRTTFLLTVMIGLTACAHTGEAPRSEKLVAQGELMIVGGGLQAENAEVIGDFLRAAGERVLVLPTASGVPAESAAGTIEDFAPHATPGQTLEVLAIEANTPERAFEEPFVTQIHDSSAAWFTGGKQSRILDVLRPQRADSPAFVALLELLQRGGVIGGNSAGAAMMSDPMIAGGTSRAALLCGVSLNAGDAGVQLEQGLGFFPFGLVDQHFLRRARIGRLVVALEHSGQRFGYGIAENTALAVDLATSRGRVLGQRGVVVVDMQHATRVEWSRRNLRVSLLSRGDQVDFESGALLAESRKQRVVRWDEPTKVVGDKLQPWDRYALSILMERLSRAPERSHRAEGADFTLVLRADGATRFFGRESEQAGFTVLNAILDIEALETAALSAERLSTSREGGAREP